MDDIDTTSPGKATIPEVVESPPPKQSLFEKVKKKVVAQEADSPSDSEKVKYPPEMEESLQDKEGKTLRGRLLRWVGEQHGHREDAATFVRSLEQEHITRDEKARFWGVLLNGMVKWSTQEKSVMENFAQSKGMLTPELYNEANAAIFFQFFGLRASIITGTRFPDFSKGLKVFENTVKGKKVVAENIREIWPEYLRFTDQSEVLFASRIGKPDSDSFHISLEDDEVTDIQERSQNLAAFITATWETYQALRKHDPSVPFGCLDKQNRIVSWDENTGYVPVLLSRGEGDSVQTAIVNINLRELDPSKQLEDVQTQIIETLTTNDRRWQPPGYHAEALFAINLTRQKDLLNKDANIPAALGSNNLRPMAVFYEGTHSDGSGSRIEIVANHTNSDGFAVDFLVGMLQEKIVEKTGVKIHNQEEYRDGQILHEKYRDKQGNVTREITRTILEEAHGADELQVALQFANDIYIQHMQRTRGGDWAFVPVGANNTHAVKNRPLERLVPGSVHYFGPDHYSNDPQYADIAEVVSIANALRSYKDQKFRIENYDQIKDDPRYTNPLPASAEIMATVTENKMPQWMKKTIIELQKHPMFNLMARTMTYPQTVVTDIVHNRQRGVTHGTVNNRGLPGVSQREEISVEDGKVYFEQVFTAAPNNDLMPPGHNEIYADIASGATAECANIMGKIQKLFESNPNPPREQLVELSKQLSEVRTKYSNKLWVLDQQASW